MRPLSSLNARLSGHVSPQTRLPMTRGIHIGMSLVLALCLPATAMEPMVFPGKVWQAASPESQGVNSLKLNEALAFLGQRLGGVGISEVVVVRNGYLIWQGTNIDACHKIWSCTKTFTGTVLGLLIQDGKCTLDTRAVEHWPALDDRYSLYGQITLRHLATMTSGYQAAGRGYDDPRWNEPVAPLAKPGAQWRYNDNPMNLFGYLLTRIAGEPLKDVFKRRIADPIGLTAWDWGDWGVRDGLRVNDAAGYLAGIKITARDMARFGLLFLNRGNWDGKQLVDPAWVDQATTNQVPVTLAYANWDGRGIYGFNWYVNGLMANGQRRWPSAPPRTFSPRGGKSNCCFVVPEWNMVIVHLEAEARLDLKAADPIWEYFFRRLSRAVQPAHGGAKDPAPVRRIPTSRAGEIPVGQSR